VAPTPAEPPCVSVIVPVRDAADELNLLLQRLAAQTLPRHRFEVIIADDGSQDGATSRLDTADGWLRVSPGPPQNPYAARNRAAGIARGRVLAFTDSDCLPEPDWLERGLDALRHVDIVAGVVRFVPPARRTAWALLDIDTFLDQERIVRTGGAVTANLFLARERFEAIGGFDGSLANGGDQELVRRCVARGARLRFAPEVVVWHPTRGGAGDVLRKVWRVHRRHATRESRAGRRPGRLTARAMMPLVPQVRSRRRRGCGFGVDRRRLADSGMQASLLDDVRTIPVIYFVLPYLATAAEAVGWLDGRRSRRASAGQGG
jgi:glycosyltransferase involved in cell wall biosynthesis